MTGSADEVPGSQKEILMKSLFAALLMLAVAVVPAVAATTQSGGQYTGQSSDIQNPPVAHGANS